MAKLNLNEIEKRLSEIRGVFPNILDWLPIERVVDIDLPALIAKVREFAELLRSFQEAETRDGWDEEIGRALEGLEL